MTTKNGNAAPVKRVENKRPGLFFDLLRRLVLEKPMGTFGLGLYHRFFHHGDFLQIYYAVQLESDSPARTPAGSVRQVLSGH